MLDTQVQHPIRLALTALATLTTTLGACSMQPAESTSSSGKSGTTTSNQTVSAARTTYLVLPLEEAQRASGAAWQEAGLALQPSTQSFTATINLPQGETEENHGNGDLVLGPGVTERQARGATDLQHLENGATLLVGVGACGNADPALRTAPLTPNRDTDTVKGLRGNECVSYKAYTSSGSRGHVVWVRIDEYSDTTTSTGITVRTEAPDHLLGWERLVVDAVLTCLRDHSNAPGDERDASCRSNDVAAIYVYRRFASELEEVRKDPEVNGTLLQAQTVCQNLGLGYNDCPSIKGGGMLVNVNDIAEKLSEDADNDEPWALLSDDSNFYE